jgi:hypothetical protein
MLRWPYVRLLRAASIGGQPVDVDALDLGEHVVHRAAGWPCGWRNVSIAYEHGLDTTPGDVARAAMLLARRALVESTVDERVRQLTTADGGAQFLIAGEGRSFDVPEANAVVAAYRIGDVLIA